MMRHEEFMVMLESRLSEIRGLTDERVRVEAITELTVELLEMLLTSYKEEENVHT